MIADINKRSVLVLVVDDQVDRKATYETFVESLNRHFASKWDLTCAFCSSLGDLANVKTSPYAFVLAVVDMVLESPWTFETINLLDEKLLEERWPLLLVSANFGSNEAIRRFNRLLDGHNLVMSQFLMWSSIERAKDGLLIGDLAFIVDSLLCRGMSQDMRFSKGPDDPVDILHITDAHFGKANWNVGELLSLRAKLKDSKLGQADFLAITGDMADHAAPHQYSAAIEYLNALAGNEIVAHSERKVAKERVFICPGNHDFSRRIALAANIAGNDSFDGKFQVKKAFSTENDWVLGYAMSPYQEFESSIAGHSGSAFPKPGYRVNSKFASHGFLILELNVEKFPINEYQPGLRDADIQKSLNDAATALSGSRAKRDCLIVLAHRHENNLWIEAVQVMNSFLRGLAASGPVILLCGHQHTAKIYTEVDDQILIIRGIPPTLGASRPEGVHPMIHWLRLLRSGNIVLGVEIHQFNQGAGGWYLYDGGKKEYRYRSGRWSLEVT